MRFALLLLPSLAFAQSATAVRDVQDEGTRRPRHDTINFTGAGVVCVDDDPNSRTNCTIAASGGAFPTLQEEGVALPVEPTINFVGATVTAADDIPNGRTNVTITSGGGTGACSAGQYESADNSGSAPTCAQVQFSQLSGSATVAQGGTGNVAPSDDQVLVGNGTGYDLKAIPNCAQLGRALTYDSSTNSFGCASLVAAVPFARRTNPLSPPCNAVRRTNCR